MHPFVADAAYRALGCIFWGTLICVFDVWISEHTNGFGFRFDFINDVIGTVMVAWGIGNLSTLINETEYRLSMGFCWVLAVLSIFEALIDHIVVPWPVPLQILSVVFGFTCLVGVHRFCAAMREFCWTGAMPEVEQSWRLSQRLWMVLVLVPGLFLRALSILAQMSGAGGTIDAGVLTLLPVTAGLVAFVHVLVSIARTRRDLSEKARLSSLIA